MKKIFLIVFILFPLLGVKAQGSLQFNQVRLVSSTLLSVPSGKVWKVTAVYGAENRTPGCTNVYNIVTSPTHELNSLRCAFQTIGTLSSYQYGNISYYRIRVLNVNGVGIAFGISGLSSSSTNLYTDAGCSSGCCPAFTASCANFTTDPTLLPLWLPAGTTVVTGGPNTYASIIEFNIIP